MTQYMIERAEYYLSLLERVRARVQDDETARAILNEVGKDHRTEMMRNRSNVAFDVIPASKISVNGDDPATAKQLGLLRRLGINPPEGLTKRSASALIDDARGNGNDIDDVGDLAATSKQLGLLRRLGVPFNGSLTKARASELIDSARSQG